MRESHGALGIRQVIAFLRNSGWEVLETDTVYDFVRSMVDTRPQFVLIQSHFSSSKVKNLLQAVMPMSPAHLIGFLEFDSTVEVQKLRSLDCEFILEPPLVGSQIEKNLLRLHNRAEQKLVDSKTSGMLDSDLIHLRGTRAELLTHHPTGEAEHLARLLEDQRKLDHATSTVWQTFGQIFQPVSEEFKELTMPLTNVNRLACLEIENKVLSHRLIAVFATSGERGDSFYHRIKLKIETLLLGLMPDCKFYQLVICDVPTVPFKAWAQSSAIQYGQNFFDNEEVGFAVFHQSDPFSVTDEGDTRMVSFELQTLDKISVLPFGVYLNLPLNQKKILYSREKNQFEAWRADRLHRKGVRKMQLLREQIPTILQFHIEKFIRNNVANYHRLAKISS